MKAMPKRIGNDWTPTDSERESANATAIGRLAQCAPVLVGVLPAADVIEGFKPNMIFTSGPTLPWSAYLGGQRRAIIGGALYEGLAANADEADALLARGDIVVSSGHEYGCVGSLAGVTTPSMPVLIVEDPVSGRRGYCTLYEGDAADRLNYGAYTDATRRNLDQLRDSIAPALDKVIRSLDAPVELLPIMRKAVPMGDELHSRNTAATSLFVRECLAGMEQLDAAEMRALAGYFNSGDYFFLRLSMAAAKVMADAMVGVAGSSIVTAMGFSCREFGVQISAFPGRWFRGPLPTFRHQKIVAPHTADDIEFMGGESVITEVCGLGANALAAALPLQKSSGGSVEALIAMAEEMYAITAAEHPQFAIPVLNYRGTPLGIDVERVVTHGITPLLDIGIAGKDGGQIGGGVAQAPLEPFLEALEQLDNR